MEILKLSHLNRFIRVFCRVNPWEAIRDLINRIVHKLVTKSRFYVYLDQFSYPICLRFDTSDLAILRQVFMRQEYGICDAIKDPKIIIDCGANVGFASLYFLNQFPNARLISLEPENENFQICQMNLRYYKKRVALLKQAIWSHPQELIVDRESYGFGTEASFQVFPCSKGQDSEVMGIDIPGLMSKYHLDTIDLLKVDIERAEIEIFGKNSAAWLSKVKNIVIELHDQECEQVFFNALRNYQYEIRKGGELTFCSNISPK